MPISNCCAGLFFKIERNSVLQIDFVCVGFRFWTDFTWTTKGGDLFIALFASFSIHIILQEKEEEEEEEDEEEEE